jgi:hypothetical protein
MKLNPIMASVSTLTEYLRGLTPKSLTPEERRILRRLKDELLALQLEETEAMWLILYLLTSKPCKASDDGGMPEFKCPQLGSAVSALVGELIRVRTSKPSATKPQVITPKTDKPKATAQKAVTQDMA